MQAEEGTALNVTPTVRRPFSKVGPGGNPNTEQMSMTEQWY